MSDKPDHDTAEYAARRRRMVAEQIRGRGISDPAVLGAMERVPRHAFVPEEYRAVAYDDTPLPIGGGQTISQPYMVAMMTEALGLRGSEHVLEIGTGSGYAAAILACLAASVVTIERIGSLADRARAKFGELGYGNVTVICGDGTKGWALEAPYDGIVVTAGAPHVPETLKSQLKIDGRLVIPVGHDTVSQKLLRVTRKTEKTFDEKILTLVRFVPLIGEEGWHEDAPGPRPREPFA